MAISVIFFDVGGTLVRPRASVGEIYARRAAAFGVAAEAEAIDAGFRRASAAAPPLAFALAPDEDLLALERAWWQRVVRGAFAEHEFADFDGFFDSLYDEFAGSAAWEVFPDVFPVLETLRRRGLELGVISNFDQRLLPLLRDLDLSRFFTSVTFSSAAAFAKPDARIFAQALRLQGAAASQAMHVGDNLREDVEGARGAGMKGLLVRADGGGLDVVLDAALP